MQLREYIVTLFDYNDLASFYNDMETVGGNLYIPQREVSVSARRPSSRNTHYLLTDEEANLLRNDSRVMSVELSLEEQGIKISPCYTDVSLNWNKSSAVASTHKNWGLLRVVEGATRPSWGGSGANSNVSGSINVTASARNVDVVIIDGDIDPSHPEFAVNSDGTGGSRIIQFNWFTLNPQVLGQSTSTYTYGPYVDATFPDNNGDGYSDRTIDNDHGTHVAGIAVGNSNGWAREANVYNINPYDSSSNATTSSYVYNVFDYVRVWHQTKPINPTTGIKNPTIVNMSFGLELTLPLSTITSVRYRGTTYTGPFTAFQLAGYGIYSSSGVVRIPVRNTALEQDIQDMISAGIIVIGAAGNSFTKISNPTGTISDDYNNYFVANSVTYYYGRGTITAAPDVICVGAIASSVNETKITSSNCGPRVDLYSPGQNIMSSVNSNILGSAINDPRNIIYFLAKRSGTSMASPQVTGVIACLAEVWPTVKQDQARLYIQRQAKLDQIVSGTGGPADYTDLQGSANRYLYFYKERLEFGQVGPKINQGNRPNVGQVWPRPKIFRYGR